MEFKRNSIRINLYGETVDLIAPNFRMVEKFNAELKKHDENDQLKSFSIVKDFLVECGLKLEQIENMEIEHVFELVELLTPKKKT